MAKRPEPPHTEHPSPQSELVVNAIRKLRHRKVTSAELGTAAETHAAEFLEAHGLVVLARNLRCKAGELDLVCLDGEVLVIVEVRHRTRTDFGDAAASVTVHKQRKVIRATRFFWQRSPNWRSRLLRFDVVALHGKPFAVAPRTHFAQMTDAVRGMGAAPEIEWIKDAFRAT